MPKIKKLPVKAYLTDKWEDGAEVKEAMKRLGSNGSKEFAMGWLTAHTILDSNRVEIIDPTRHSQEIAKGVREWVEEKF